MMRICAVGCAILVFATFGIAAQDRAAATYSSYIGNQRLTASLSRASILASPEWLAADDFPPLSPRKAIAVAREGLKKIESADGGEWQLTNVRLEKLPDREHWWYVVEFIRPKLQQGISNLDKLQIPVLFSGESVLPAAEGDDHVD